jgi:hypothetical protein
MPPPSSRCRPIGGTIDSATPLQISFIVSFATIICHAV